VQEGVAQAQAALGAGSLVGNLLGQGWKEALDPAQALALQGGQQGYGATTNLASLLSGGYSTAAQQAANMAGTNLGLGSTAAQQLPQLASAQSKQDAADAAMLQSIGQSQQQQAQAELNAQQAQFNEAQQYPETQMSWLSGILGSIPYGQTTSGTSYGTQQQTQTPSTMGTVGQGLGAAASIASIISAL
jgi:hypothetical protein